MSIFFTSHVTVNSFAVNQCFNLLLIFNTNSVMVVMHYIILQINFQYIFTELFTKNA